MFDIITVGGITQDIFLRSKKYRVKDGQLSFVWGEKFVVDDMVLSSGGGGANAAVAFSRLGFKTALWARVGDDFFGQLIKKQLTKEKISLKFLEVDKECKTATSAIFSGPSGERSIVMYRGKADLLDLTTAQRQDFWKTRWLYIGDLTGDLSNFEDYLFAQARERGVRIIFIPGQNQFDLKILKKVLDSVNVFILNVYEASQVLNIPFSHYSKNRNQCQKCVPEVKAMLEALHDCGPELVVITKDVCGSQAFDGINFYEYPNSEVEKVVDTTGAGDAFSSGFMAGMMWGWGIEKCLELGTRNAGSVISQFGAQSGLLRKQEIKGLRD